MWNGLTYEERRLIQTLNKITKIPIPLVSSEEPVKRPPTLHEIIQEKVGVIQEIEELKKNKLVSKAKEQHSEALPVDDKSVVIDVNGDSVEKPDKETENDKQEPSTEETDVENVIKDGDIDKVD